MKSSEKYLFGNLGWWYHRLSVVVPLIRSSGTPRAQKPWLYSVVVLSEPAMVPPVCNVVSYRSVHSVHTNPIMDQYTWLAKVKSMHRVDTFGNSLGVCRKLAEGIESLPGWCKGVRQKMTETRQKIIEGSRKACRRSGCSDDAVRSRRKFARRFTEGIGKLIGNAKGDRWKEDWRTYRKIAGGCRSARELGLN
ncbi:hypothetical protein B296_00041827 [Ensete ventricosum]|uniref:Uncharacterized protein n=1 Tax=Ensete ventricosum TaxID=4639 RepID=A0A426XWI3_ENSVE|nr:hypothetical protein B296_00041827 [Ensete ventricosum]